MKIGNIELDNNAQLIENKFPKLSEACYKYPTIVLTEHGAIPYKEEYKHELIDGGFIEKFVESDEHKKQRQLKKVKKVNK